MSTPQQRKQRKRPWNRAGVQGDDMSTEAILALICLIVIVIAVVRERRRIAAERALPPAPPVGVVVTPEPNHLLHLILTVFTCGAWGLIWLVIALFERREIHAVDAYGRIVDRESATPAIAGQPPAENTVAHVPNASDAPAVAKAATKKCPLVD
jgi:hypothetical protein